MANRVIRGDILDSESVNKLSWPAEVFYRRLMSILDDFGFGDGRISIMRSKLFPLRLDKVSESDVVKWLSECESAGLVRIYHVNEKPYIELFNFNQTVRIKKHKFPVPADGKQMQADASMLHPERERESESETNLKRNPNPKGITLPEFEKLFDPLWFETMQMVHRGKDIPQAIREAYAHLAAGNRLYVGTVGDFKRCAQAFLSNMRTAPLNGKAGVKKFEIR
jgi:hypothetical protein